MKYQKTYPGKFNDIMHAMDWMKKYEIWYNTEHLHSGNGYTTNRRYGNDIEKLQKKTYIIAKSKNPSRWSKDTRKWNSTNNGYLNPHKKIWNK